MSNRWTQIFLAVLLGAVLPGVIFGIWGRQLQTTLQQPQAETTQPLQTQPQTQPQADPTAPVEPTKPTQGFTLPVLMTDGTVKELALDDYLTAVVLREMPASFEPEALKAQAVVARTYTLHKLSGGKHEAAVVCADPGCCQGYCSAQEYLQNGGTQALLEKVRQAVTETKDLVLTYDGELIEATYFSCSGGRTEDAQAVWGTDIPYLQATDSPGEEAATYYTDTVTFSASEFSNLLGGTMTGPAGTWLEAVTYTDGGGVATMTLCGKTYQGTELRQLLGLRSTAFALTAVGDSVTITTKGFGHRVGMSQYGADAMAVSGSSFEEILAHYYQGTVLQHYVLDD